jgi:hypothetical protein
VLTEDCNQRLEALNEDGLTPGADNADDDGARSADTLGQARLSIPLWVNLMSSTARLSVEPRRLPAARRARLRHRSRSGGAGGVGRRWGRRPVTATLVTPAPPAEVSSAAVAGDPKIAAHVRQRSLVLASLVLCPGAELGERHQPNRP